MGLSKGQKFEQTKHEIYLMYRDGDLPLHKLLDLVPRYTDPKDFHPELEVQVNMVLQLCNKLNLSTVQDAVINTFYDDRGKLKNENIDTTTKRS